jgi:hypothetical protein
MLDVVSTGTVQTVCKYAGEVALHFHICNQCDSFLELCTPRIGGDGWLEGSECDISACEGCDVTNCIYYPTYLERRRTA